MQHTPHVTPLSAEDIDALLRPDLRSLNADLLALRDGLDRMTAALWKLAAALGAFSPDRESATPAE